MTLNRSRRRIKLGSLYVWHRYLGVGVAFIVAMLSVTGIMLNHSGDLKLDSSYVSSEHVLDWYGIDLPTEHISFKFNGFRMSLIGYQLYLGNKKIMGQYSRLSGFVVSEDMLVVAANNGLLLLTGQGEIIEKPGVSLDVPEDIKRLGLLEGAGIVVSTSSGTYQADKTLTTWKKVGNIEGVSWSLSSIIPVNLFSELSRLYRGQELTHERVVQDLHSGRIFGKWGPAFMDMAAVIILLLSVSGLWLWVKGIIRRRQHRRRKRARV